MSMLRYIWAVPNTLVGVLFLSAALLRGGHLQVVDGVLEAWGPLLSALLQRLPIAGGAAAITFGHIVLARDLESMLRRAVDYMPERERERYSARRRPRAGGKRL